FQDAKHNGRVLRQVPWLDKAGHMDFWAPFATTLQYRRSCIEDFASDIPLLKADPARVAFWRARLSAVGRGPFAGLAWKSLVLTGRRDKFHAPIRQWAPVLSTPGVTFVNLQYGDCTADLTEARERLGVTIHNFEDLDIKNNLDDNAALCTALDLAITA